MSGSTAPSPACSTTSRRSRLIVLGIAALVIVVDAVSKIWAMSALQSGSVHVVGDLLVLRLVRNPGAAFGSFGRAGPLIGVLAVVATAWVFYYAGRVRRIWPLVGLGLIAGGAVGNLVDRILRAPGWLSGSVVDFIEVPHWPVFNLADSAVVVGVVLVILTLGRGRTKEEEVPVEAGNGTAPGAEADRMAGEAEAGSMS